MTDWRMAIELVCGPDAYYGWLNPDSFNDILGRYEYIVWRDSKIPKPTKGQLETAWANYVAQNGTPQEQQVAKEQVRRGAIARLKATTGNEDILTVLGIEI